MYQKIRAATVVAASAVVLGVGVFATTVPSVANADSETSAAPTDKIEGSLVQIQTKVSGSIFVKFDVENSVEGWSEVSETVVCTGVAVEEDRILTSASCTDAKSYAIVSELRQQAAKDILIKDGRTPQQADLLSVLGSSQKWDVVADPEHPDQPANVTTTVRRVGAEGASVTATQELSTYGTSDLAGPVSLIRMANKLDGLKPALFSEVPPAVQPTVYVAAPATATFDGAAPTANLRKTAITGIPLRDGKQAITLRGEERPQDFGAPVVNTDGLVIGLLPYSSSSTGIDSVSLRTYLTGKGVTFAEEETEKSSNMWLWLGPVIGVGALILIAGGFFVVNRRRKKAAPQGVSGFPVAGQQFPGQQFPGQQFPNQQQGPQQYQQVPTPQQQPQPQPQAPQYPPTEISPQPPTQPEA